jgi:hypothetical protein
MSSNLHLTTNAENTELLVHPHCPPSTASIATEHGWKPLLLRGTGQGCLSILSPFVRILICERANSVEDAIRRGQRQVEQVRIKMGLQMDDKTFQAALLETQVFRPYYRGDLLNR